MNYFWLLTVPAFQHTACRLLLAVEARTSTQRDTLETFPGLINIFFQSYPSLFFVPSTWPGKKWGSITINGLWCFFFFFRLFGVKTVTKRSDYSGGSWMDHLTSQLRWLNGLETPHSGALLAGMARDKIILVGCTALTPRFYHSLKDIIYSTQSKIEKYVLFQLKCHYT